MHSVVVAEVGEVLIKKSPRAKRIILRFNHTGHPVVTLPRYIPYRIGQQFALSHRDWILQHQPKQSVGLLHTGQQIGRDHILSFEAGSIAAPKSRVTDSRITVRYPDGLLITDQGVQAEAQRAIRRAIKRQAEYYLLPQLRELAKLHGHTYKEGRIKLLRSRWGSCSRGQIITLNAWLVQLPQEWIDYVICHELAHLSHPHHQADFWQAVETMVPNYKELRKKLRAWQPRLIETEDISFT